MIDLPSPVLSDAEFLHIRKLAWRTVHRRGASVDVANEVAQLTTIRFYEKPSTLPAFDDGAEGGGDRYVARTAINIWHDEIRSDQRRKRREHRFTGAPLTPDQPRPGVIRARSRPSSPSHEDIYGAVQLVEELVGQLNRLYSQIARMWIYEDLPVTEIARRLGGLSLATTYRRIDFLRSRLREELEPELRESDAA